MTREVNGTLARGVTAEQRDRIGLRVIAQLDYVEIARMEGLWFSNQVRQDVVTALQSVLSEVGSDCEACDSASLAQAALGDLAPNPARTVAEHCRECRVCGPRLDALRGWLHELTVPPPLTKAASEQAFVASGLAKWRAGRRRELRRAAFEPAHRSALDVKTFAIVVAAAITLVCGGMTLSRHHHEARPVGGHSDVRSETPPVEAGPLCALPC